MAAESNIGYRPQASIASRATNGDDLGFFALTKHALFEILNLARGNKSAIWVNGGLLDVATLEQLRAEGFDLTDFVRWIDPGDGSSVQAAVAVIREHHPNQVLYIEQI
ncbi:hypothetical protein [Dyella sp. 20L07]|uniref:hypothetical protein n=1 Tax=Dyella sp. 20L07 TaxID=3384240 RepID=UPI003D299DF4